MSYKCCIPQKDKEMDMGDGKCKCKKKEYAQFLFDGTYAAIGGAGNATSFAPVTTLPLQQYTVDTCPGCVSCGALPACSQCYPMTFHNYYSNGVNIKLDPNDSTKIIILKQGWYRFHYEGFVSGTVFVGSVGLESFKMALDTGTTLPYPNQATHIIPTMGINIIPLTVIPSATPPVPVGNVYKIVTLPVTSGAVIQLKGYSCGFASNVRNGILEIQEIDASENC